MAAWQESAEISLEKLKLTRAHTAKESRKSKQDAKSSRNKTEMKNEPKTLTLSVDNAGTQNPALKVRRRSK